MTDGTSGGASEQAGLSVADEQLLRELTERARAGGLKLTGEGGRADNSQRLPPPAGGGGTDHDLGKHDHLLGDRQAEIYESESTKSNA